MNDWLSYADDDDPCWWLKITTLMLTQTSRHARPNPLITLPV